MTVLSVNVNKVALLRNARNIGVPSVTRFARIAIDSGAAGITVHPRPDQRHIRPSDVDALAAMLDVEFNIEGNPFAGPAGSYPGFMEIVRKARPAQCTLVPDSPGQLTSDHGWVITGDVNARLRPLIDDLHGMGARVSLFMDAEPDRMQSARDCGADRVELYTEPYARAFDAGDATESLSRYTAAARAARDLGMGVNAGHDLNLQNLGAFCRAVPDVLEVSIGHALIAESLEMGLAATVQAYLRILSGCE
jgi:pyridoxine 5-phosphate synthase